MYDINEGNLLNFNSISDNNVPAVSDPDADIPDNTEETGFRYNNYGATGYATSEDEPESGIEEYPGDECPECNEDENPYECPVCGAEEESENPDESYSDDEFSDDYEDSFIEL